MFEREFIGGAQSQDFAASSELDALDALLKLERVLEFTNADYHVPEDDSPARCVVPPGPLLVPLNES